MTDINLTPEAKAAALRELADGIRTQGIPRELPNWQTELVRMVLIAAVVGYEAVADDELVEEYRGTGRVEHVEWSTRGVAHSHQHAVALKVAVPVAEFAGLDINRSFTIVQEKP